jgi:hypothetical protein
MRTLTAGFTKADVPALVPATSADAESPADPAMRAAAVPALAAGSNARQDFVRYLDIRMSVSSKPRSSVTGPAQGYLKTKAYAFPGCSNLLISLAGVRLAAATWGP